MPVCCWAYTMLPVKTAHTHTHTHQTGLHKPLQRTHCTRPCQQTSTLNRRRTKPCGSAEHCTEKELFSASKFATTTLLSVQTSRGGILSSALFPLQVMFNRLKLLLLKGNSPQRGKAWGSFSAMSASVCQSPFSNLNWQQAHETGTFLLPT